MMPSMSVFRWGRSEDCGLISSRGRSDVQLEVKYTHLDIPHTCPWWPIDRSGKSCQWTAGSAIEHMLFCNLFNGTYDSYLHESAGHILKLSWSSDHRVASDPSLMELLCDLCCIFQTIGNSKNSKLLQSLSRKIPTTATLKYLFTSNSLCKTMLQILYITEKLFGTILNHSCRI